MKFYLKLFGGLILLIAILLWLQSASDESSRSVSGASASATPASVATQALPLNSVLAAAEPQPALTPAPTPLSAPAASPETTQLVSAAQRAGLQVAGIASQDGWLLVTVRGRDRNQVAEFLDVARQAGMRDIDLNYHRYTQFVSQGRLVAQDTYRLKF